MMDNYNYGSFDFILCECSDRMHGLSEDRLKKKKKKKKKF